MVRYKYTPDVLAEAAAAARNITEVMRLLGVRVSGGSHAHISRQLKKFGIDTSHFTGSAHNRGSSAPRVPAHQVLIKLPRNARRTPGTRLKRALLFIGLPVECEACGVGTVWQGRSLVLHVDHINGDFLDNRPPNLRLLCPNCHSQTNTYAGRKPRADAVNGRASGSQPAADAERPPPPLADDDIYRLLRQVEKGEVTAVEAARLIKCSRRHVSTLVGRLRATGTIDPPSRARTREMQQRFTDLVIGFALAHPEWGAHRVAQGLADMTAGECALGGHAVSAILRSAGLCTPAARHSRISKLAGVA
ncbi:hypothetical protein ACWD6N_07745 [Micromonospora sp. NPDC005163]